MDNAVYGYGYGLFFAAPVMYCLAPSEWGSIMIIVAGAVQAFVVLQITILEERQRGKLKDT